jgi:hypothetical protein
MARLTQAHWRWIVGLCILLLAAVTGWAYFGPQVLVYLRMRRITGPQALWEVPRPLSDTSVSPAPGTTLAYFGYKFEVPWTGVEKETNEGRWVKVLFESGEEVFFANPAYFQDDILLLSRKWEPEAFREAFGAHPLSSKYEHLRAVLSMTPSRLSPLRTHRVFARDRVYLASKGLWFAHTNEARIFAIRTEAGYKGFETDERPFDGSVVITLFDATDRKFSIRVSRASASGATLTQPDVNRIIETFGPANPKPVSDNR